MAVPTLEHAPGPHRPRQHVQERAGLRIDDRQPLFVAGLRDDVDLRMRHAAQAGEVGDDQVGSNLPHQNIRL